MTIARERAIAWAGAGVACVYFLWLGFVLSRGAGRFGSMFEGLGAQVPAPTRLLLDHHVVLFGATFGVSALGVLIKEGFVPDKRISLMITMLLVIIIRFIADAFLTVYYLPLFDLIQKLS